MQKYKEKSLFLSSSLFSNVRPTPNLLYSFPFIYGLCGTHRFAQRSAMCPSCLGQASGRAERANLLSGVCHYFFFSSSFCAFDYFRWWSKCARLLVVVALRLCCLSNPLRLLH